mgnify:CR=1 FL=1
MKFKRPRGTQDLFGENMEIWAAVESRLSALARSYGYGEIRTPIFEQSDLFVRAVGEATDIVSKEMYTFEDKKGRSLTLRPENTAPVMRAFIENGLHRSGGVSRFWYMGPMFRYDRPQAGRYRQFHQFGAEAIGSPGPAVDAEIIDMSLALYGMFGFSGLEVRINSVGCPVCRPGYREVLAESLEDRSDLLCEACSSRAAANPLRIFDCKECDEVKEVLPRITDHLCGECEEHLAGLLEILDDTGIDYMRDPLLVRGLDYYTRTAYEVIHPGLGGQNALCGGGRYDGLAEECGGGSIPAVGFSAGMERLIENLPEGFLQDLERPAPDVFFVSFAGEGEGKVLSLASRLRGAGLAVSVELSGRSVKKQMKAASESGARLAVIIGPEELDEERASLKDLSSGEQERVPFEDLLSTLMSRREMDVE